jgi:hypothetical protein
MPEENGQVIEMLQGIWSEMKSVNARVDRVRDDLRAEIAARIDGLRTEMGLRLDDTSARLDATNARLDGTNARLEAGFARMDRRFDQLLLGEHGREHREIRERLGRIEAHLGLPKP